MLWENELRREIVTVGPGLAISYDVDGNELWRMNGMTPAPSATSVIYEDKLILNAGKGKPMVAIAAGAKGDITEAVPGEPESPVLWKSERTGTYIPSAVAYDGGLYILNDNGALFRLDTESGDVTFRKRISDSDADGTDFSASAWAARGCVFFASEQGNTYVLKAGDEYELSHINRLGDWIMASPALAGDRLILRTESTLYSIRG